MLASRRAWLLHGSAVPSTVVVRPVVEHHKLCRGDGVSVIGDEHARSLARHLRPLLVSSGAVIIPPGRHPEDDAEVVLQASEEVGKAKVVLVSWPRVPTGLEKVGSVARARGRSVALVGTMTGLLSRRIPVFDPLAWDIPLGPDGKTPTAHGYASWAGALWWWIR